MSKWPPNRILQYQYNLEYFFNEYRRLQVQQLISAVVVYLKPGMEVDKMIYYHIVIWNLFPTLSFSGLGRGRQDLRKLKGDRGDVIFRKKLPRNEGENADFEYIILLFYRLVL